MRTRLVLVLTTTLGISGCLTGVTTYTAPSPVPAPPAAIVVARPKSEVWADLIPRLAQTFFVINNIDQSSGLINISYSGDPEAFVDCGQIVSTVKNARGERTYQFPGSRANAQFEAKIGNDLVAVTRTLSLEGRANVVLQETPPGSTRATVNIRYMLTRHIQNRSVMGATGSSTDNIAFNTGEAASFPGSGQTTTCRSSGVLEQRILALFSK